MAHLQSLPEELLVLICHYLRQPDLYNVSLCCKKLAHATVDALYYAPYCQQIGDNDSGTSLLHTISTRSRHARLIRHLRFNYFNIASGRPQQVERYRKSHNAASVYRSADPCLWETLELCCSFYSDDLALAAIVYYATNLESLMLGNNFYSIDSRKDCHSTPTTWRIDGTLFLQVLEMVNTFARPNGSNLLDRLTTVILMDPHANETENPEHDIGPTRWNSSQAAHLLRLPTLRTFIATDLQERFDDTVDELTNVLRLSNVTTLRLLRCNISSKVMSLLLRCCKALETFHWTATCAEGLPPDNEVHINCADIYNELFYFSETLKFVGLYGECICRQRYPCFTSHVTSFETLIPLQKLESLMIQESGQDFDGDYDDEGNETLDHAIDRLPAGLKDLVYFLSDILVEYIYLHVLVGACQARPEMRAELCSPGPIAEELIGVLSNRYPELTFEMTVRDERRQEMPCIRIEHRGRVHVESAAEKYEALVSAAYAPYEGGTPRNRPHGNTT